MKKLYSTTAKHRIESIVKLVKDGVETMVATYGDGGVKFKRKKAKKVQKER